MRLGNPVEDRVRAEMCALSPAQAARAATLISRLKKAMEQQARIDAAVERSLARVLAPLVRAEVDRAMGRN
jgi:hypothetical protein